MAHAAALLAAVLASCGPSPRHSHAPDTKEAGPDPAGGFEPPSIVETISKADEAIGIPFDDFPPPDPVGFVAYGKWDRSQLTWHLAEAPEGIPADQARLAVAAAFGQWAAAARLEFDEVSNPADADIVIDMRSGGAHGCWCPFSESTLAHAFFPGLADPVCPPGEIHVNQGQPFVLPPVTTGGGHGFDYQTVVLHEIGHALGLGHSPVGQAVMWSRYAGVRRVLHEDDRAGIASIYGAHGQKAWLGSPVFEEPRCVRGGDPVEVCFASRGVEGAEAEVTILEVDQKGTMPVETLYVVVEPLDYDPEQDAWLTCLGFFAEWVPDGPGHPEYVARVVVSGVPPAATPAVETEMLHVGKTTVPTGAGCP